MNHVNPGVYLSADSGGLPRKRLRVRGVDRDVHKARLRNLMKILPRKEVIHPQLPLGMPCYDFAPIIDPTLVTPKGRFRYYRLSWRDGR